MLRTPRATKIPTGLRRSQCQEQVLSSSRALCIATGTNTSSVHVKNYATTTSPSPSPRPTPAPSFNIPVEGRNHVQPLINPRTPEMDESFIGKTGGEIFHEMMRRNSVKHIFGYPGGTILPVFDAIYQSRHFDFILPKHEQGAGHMAEGYARASGKPGVVIVTSGPGATNVITPMQNALSDGTPMVVFCGQVVTSAIGSDAFQEADIVGISRSCTKWNIMVKTVAELPRRINEAFQIATSGRPGPVLVDLPKDVTASILRRAIPTELALPVLPAMSSTAVLEATRQQLHGSIHRIADLINIAKKPVIYAGQGILSSNGPQLLKELADKASIPVTTSLQGLGAFDEHDEKSLHMLGTHGSAYANMAIQEADLILALGARFDDRVTVNYEKFAPAARTAAAEGRGGIVQFEITPKNINKVVQATEAVQGDVSENLRELLPHIENRSMTSRKDWFDNINSWKGKWPVNQCAQAGKEGAIKPQALIEELSNLTDNRKENTIITTGVGQHQMLTAHCFRWRYPRTIVTSGGLGTMGYGLPAAIGAKVARPDALVIDIDGDASFSKSLSELSTAAQFNIGVKVIVLNNEDQRFVKQWQNRSPDLVELAKAMHFQGRTVRKTKDIADALNWLINTDGPALLEVVTDKEAPRFHTRR